MDGARKEHEPRTFLLQGITGSGKTEVYLRLTERALADGGQVLVLVPEIALTGQTVKRFKAWFGGAVAVAHSKLSASERADVWQKNAFRPGTGTDRGPFGRVLSLFQSL